MNARQAAIAKAGSVVDFVMRLEFAVDGELVMDDAYYDAVTCEMQAFIDEVQVALEKEKAETDAQLMALNAVWRTR
jgi:hypothetical protein